MLTGPALKTLATALCTGGALAVATAGPATAAPSAASPATAHGTSTAHATSAAHGAPASAAAPSVPSWGGGGSVWGTVLSAGEMNLRQHPDTASTVVYAFGPGSAHRIECRAQGSQVHGNPYWYWFPGANGWGSAAYVDTGGQQVPTCSDPCPGWKPGGGDGGQGSGRHDQGGGHDSGGRHDGGRNDSGSFYFHSESTLEFGFTFG